MPSGPWHSLSYVLVLSNIHTNVGLLFLSHSLLFVPNKSELPNPVTAIFGVVPNGVAVSVAQSDAIAFSSILAQHLMLFNRQWATPPTHKR